MAERYTNIRLVLDNLLEHPLLKDLSLERAVNHTINFMRLVGVPNMFIEKTEIIHIDNYRALLPCDYYEMIQVRSSSERTFRYSTDSFHMSHHTETQFPVDLTYKIQGNVIFTSVKEDDIEIAYRAIAIDSEGYPLLPDSSEFIRALEYYIKMKHFEVLYDMNKIAPAVYQNVQQQYAWAVGACQSDFNRLSLDKAESFFNSWRTLLLRDNEHSKGFKDNGSKEYIKIQ